MIRRKVLTLLLALLAAAGGCTAHMAADCASAQLEACRAPTK